MKKRALFLFRLYVAGQSPNSIQALDNLRYLCSEHLEGRHEIEVVDVLRDTKRALDDGILVTPTLLRTSPLPVRMVIGNLANRSLVLSNLGMIEGGG
jgi:circadian clock protein KaiB